MHTQGLSQRIRNVYTQLNAANIDQLESIYSSDVVFEDPAHRIAGLPALMHYFEALYCNVNSCEFEFERTIADEEAICTAWLMHLSHPKLKGGERLTIPGCSMMLTNGSKVHHHRDYFDLGNLLYEHIPVLGSVIIHLKGRLGS